MVGFITFYRWSDFKKNMFLWNPVLSSVFIMLLFQSPLLLVRSWYFWWLFVKSDWNYPNNMPRSPKRNFHVDPTFSCEIPAFWCSQTIILSWDEINCYPQFLQLLAGFILAWLVQPPIFFWLVVWNMFFPFSWECHHPNWLSLHHFSEGLAATTNQYMYMYEYP